MDASLVAVLAGLVGVPLVNWLKARLGWSGDPVKILAIAVAAVLAIVGLGVTGQLFPVDLANLAGKIGLAFTVGQMIYVLLPKS